MSRMENQGEAAMGTVKEKAQQAGQQIRDMGNQIRDTATEYYQQGREKAQEFEERVEEYVREAPIKSVLIAAGVGMLLGIIWRRL